MAPKFQMCLRWDAPPPIRVDVTASLDVPGHPDQLCALQAAWKGDGTAPGSQRRARHLSLGVQYVSISIHG